jgi:SAM-dependent methyltransferase
MTQSAGTASAYQRDGVAYVQRVAQLFGGYKKRSFEFLGIQPGQRVLDVGCGAGDDALVLAKLVGPGGRVAGVDVAEAMIQSAQARARDLGVPVEFSVGDLLRLPFADGSFDRVRADRVFQHLADPTPALREMKRVAASGGVVSVIDVDWGTLQIRSDDEATTAAVIGFLLRAQVNPRVAGSLYERFRDAGFGDVACYADAVAVTDFAIARFLFGIDVFARRAAEAGCITAAQAEAWLAGLQKRDEDGRFFAAITGYAARGVQGKL